MKCFNQICRWSWAFLVAVTLVIGLGGCEGDDGAAGAPGANGAAGAAGADGTDGLDCWDLNGNGVGDPDEDLNNDGLFDANDCGVNLAKVTPLESCGVCHDDESFADASEFHALDPIEAVSNVEFAVALNGLDLEVNFDLADEAGAPLMTYGILRAYANAGGVVTSYSSDATMANNGGGNYTITIAGAADAAAVDSRWVFRIEDSVTETSTYFHADFPNNPFAADGPLVVGGDACQACHGPEGIRVHGANFIASAGGEPCLTCHGAVFFGEERPTLGQVAHAYHSGQREGHEHVTYPSYMTNCSVCHADADQLAAANTMTVSGENCFTCHGSIESWDFVALNLGFHLDIPDPETADCTVCHKAPADGGIAAANVAEMHNGSITERDGVIWDGADTSVTEGAKFDWQITGVAVVDEGANLEISWTAAYDSDGDGVKEPIDPCNADPAAGPVFFADADDSVDPPVDFGDNLSMLFNYAQGDDFILGESTSAPGQPNSEGVDNDNTECVVAGIATTTIPAEPTDATVARVALQGKPRVLNVDPDPDPTSSFVEEFGSTMPVRVKTPTYDYFVADGTAATPRRNVVDTKQCVGCHVGSLYQHGGNRVDNVDMCILCHNSASNEKYRRVAMGVEASEAYDGKTGETFEMKTMAHRVHSSNFDWNPADEIEEYNPPYLVYRSRGIYAFAHDASAVPNWDVISTDGCTETEISRGERLVFGGDPESTTSCQPHNFEAPTYPRSLNECTACHTADFMVIPDQTKAMANTTEAGSTDWDNQLDDVLQGAATTACVTCHADGASKGHAYQNSWTPQVFPDGRQTIIDAVN